MKRIFKGLSAYERELTQRALEWRPIDLSELTRAGHRRQERELAQRALATFDQCDCAASQNASRDAVAARMRQRNLTQGRGCVAQRRAIEKRLGITIPATTAIDSCDRLIREVQR